LITLLRTLPTIIAALRAGLKDVRAQGAGQPTASRVDQDIPLRTVVIGALVIAVMLWVLLTFHPMKDASTYWYQNLFAAIFVVVFGFLFVTVAARISGLLGNSSNPISGMSIATLMATCAIFFFAGWTAPNYSVLALMIGGVVCIAAAIAGATSQDLKTGYLVGSTPFYQQMGLLIGVTVSTLAIGTTLNLMNKGLERYLPTLAEKIWGIVQKSIGGFLGITGFLLSFIMVPIYLFFLLKERPRIESRWKDYLPLRPSPLKDEIASALLEINNYIIAYFRGQLLVCLVDGTLIGSSLTLLGLNFAPLIGLFVVILTMIPYIGIVICWVPAVLIAAFQWGDWLHPLIVTGIFILIQNLEGILYAPRIVGKSVGLHPMTVIVSIFVWGLLIGGLLGPILAVPLTATIKVLLTRYVWGPRTRDRVRNQVKDAPVGRESQGRA